MRKGQSEDKYNHMNAVRPGWSNKRPAESIETETQDEKRRTK